MDTVVVVLGVGFGVLAVLLWSVVGVLADLRNDVNVAIKHLKNMDNLSFKGTIHNQLLDIEKALNRG